MDRCKKICTPKVCPAFGVHISQTGGALNYVLRPLDFPMAIPTGICPQLYNRAPFFGTKGIAVKFPNTPRMRKFVRGGNRGCRRCSSRRTVPANRCEWFEWATRSFSFPWSYRGFSSHGPQIGWISFFQSEVRKTWKKQKLRWFRFDLTSRQIRQKTLHSSIII